MFYDETITIPALTGDEPRRAYIYVPDAARADASLRFPVLYMFDGQNLFSDAEAYIGKCWGILRYVTENNVPLIVAAIACSEHSERDECGGRLSEYSPFDFRNRRWGDITGRGNLTMDFIVNDFKPYVDENFPTLPDREHTFISGSSMGGLMTLYAVCAYGETFGRGAALSPSLSFSPKEICAMIDASELEGLVLYMDMGSEELHSARSRATYADVAARLMKKGVHLESRIVPGGIHNEGSWERQVPFFMDALLYDLP